MRLLALALFATTAFVLVPTGVFEAAGGSAKSTTDALATSVRAWLDSLETKSRERAKFAFEDEERKNWHYIPRERRGLPLKAMNPQERAATDVLLHAVLPPRGFDAVKRIMALEDVLHDIEKSDVRDREKYFVSVFGEPDDKKPFGVRYEGHHVAIDLTAVGGKRTFTPFFLGTNPAEVRSGPKKGERVLGEISDRGYQILKSLNADQLKAARISDTVPPDVKFAPGTAVETSPRPGLGLDLLNPGQFILVNVLLQTIGELAIVDDRAPRFDPHFDKSSLAFAGTLEPGTPLYFRFTLDDDIVLEYVNIQNDANHVHFLVRSKSSDFGANLLTEHLKSEH